MKNYFALFMSAIILCSSVTAKDKNDTASEKTFKVSYEKYTLSNGLKVILHEDHSDPVVAVATLVHVGSNREKPGRTGFAHFFEHMSFNDSENTPRGANRKMIPEFGGERNGGTWNDGTIFYEVVPTDAFEKILWIDSDRLGFMINTVTTEALEREKQVVKNEKRQNYDNVPYGLTDEVISKNLYPNNHPYNWTVIGQLADLQAATLSDVKEFYGQYYGPNNATLVIAGDIDIEKTKQLVERWFGEIKRGPEVEPMQPMLVNLDKNISLYYEDAFAKLPELNMVFPTVQNYHKDSYALQILAELLAANKTAPFYKVIVEEKKLAPNVFIDQSSKEIAGDFTIRIRANAGVDLNNVYDAVQESFARFEADGIKESDLERIKAGIETRFYNANTSVLNKAFSLAQYNEYAGDPSFIEKDNEMSKKVTIDDVMYVYNKYIKGKKYVMTSFVPKGNVELAVKNSQKAEVYVEEITAEKKEEQVTAGEEADVSKTPTKYDRSEPPFGPKPLFKMPKVWTENFHNGLKAFGVEYNEVPLVTFNITISGGHWLDKLNKYGTANLTARMMTQGTKNKTPEELEEAIDLLGAGINVYASNEEIVIAASTLARNYEKTLALVKEILFEPRWDEKEFARLKQEILTRLKDLEANPNFVAQSAFYKLLYGNEHILGYPVIGIQSSVSEITLNDLKEFYNGNFSPSVTSFNIVGDIPQDQILKSLKDFSDNWNKIEVKMPEYKIPENHNGKKIFFVDIPDAKQSIIFGGNLTLSAIDPDYNNLVYANEVIGNGSSSRLFQLLRIEKGYTYGAYSFISSLKEIAPLIAYTSVRTNITLEALQLFKGLFDDYRNSFGPKEVDITKNKVIKDNTRAFESMDGKMALLNNISKYDRPVDYITEYQDELLNMELDDFLTMIDKYMNKDNLFYVVVGDAKTQAPRLNELGMGEPVHLDIFGNKK